LGSPVARTLLPPARSAIGCLVSAEEVFAGFVPACTQANPDHEALVRALRAMNLTRYLESLATTEIRRAINEGGTAFLFAADRYAQMAYDQAAAGMLLLNPRSEVNP
jgi:hypothetical protein